MLGPVYVGVLAAAVGLRGAMVGVALLLGAFALLAPVVARRRDHAAMDGREDITSMPMRSDATPL